MRNAMIAAVALLGLSAGAANANVQIQLEGPAIQGVTFPNFVWQTTPGVDTVTVNYNNITDTYAQAWPTPVLEGNLTSGWADFTGFYPGGSGATYARASELNFNESNLGPLTITATDYFAGLDFAHFDGTHNISTATFSLCNACSEWVAVSEINGAPVSGYYLHISNIGAAVPEPSTWGMMILGMGLAGAVLRRRRETPLVAA